MYIKRVWGCEGGGMHPCTGSRCASGVVENIYVKRGGEYKHIKSVCDYRRIKRVKDVVVVVT